MNNNHPTELQRISHWLAGEVTVRLSRKTLVIAGVIMLLLVGFALD